MKWYDLFNIPKYVTTFEENVERDKEAQIEYVNKVLLDRVATLENQFALLVENITTIEATIQSTPVTNEIDQEEDDFVDIDENYRIPIVDGVKIRQEGQSEQSAQQIEVMSPREATRLYGSIRPRQTKSKIKH